jgi:hypothetical protein
MLLSATGRWTLGVKVLVMLPIGAKIMAAGVNIFLLNPKIAGNILLAQPSATVIPDAIGILISILNLIVK